MDERYVLGIWDGHDAGAALLKGDALLFAVNEERLSRRKLDVGFPCRSVKACLDYAGLAPKEIREIAVSTSDPAKTLTRLIPGLKEEYYLIRRRKKDPKRLDPFKKRFKYRFTELGPNPISNRLSRLYLHRELEALGFSGFNLSLLDHHACHAHAAARCSGFGEALVLTIDGVGDGLSGSIWRFKGGQMELLRRLPSKISLGIFFEHVTNLMNMRELEDEGKVMALANYAYPIEDRDNPLMKLIQTRGLEIFSRYGSMGLFRELKRILWRYPSEQFAYMAQRALEKNVLELVQNAVSLTGLNKIAVSGGVFSNIKLNMKIAELDGIKDIYVFPHMGDGGLAMGAAMAANYERHGVARYHLRDLYLGPRFGRQEILESLRNAGYPHREIGDIAGTAARLILGGEIILWFQGRMEAGPRALGNRSILARPDDRKIKDQLNLKLKKRVWYQPFCPSILLEDATSLLLTNGRETRDNRFMTTAFRVRREQMVLMEGVVNIDGTCRPHLVGDENPLYRELLVKIKGGLGKGVVLNTSFNIHGEPMVCSPDDALSTLKKTGIPYLFLEGFFIENTDTENL
ncbi:MAG: carbamoyltransferase C-terminal domain-containing protein [Pseudomonadota bacterium]